MFRATETFPCRPKFWHTSHERRMAVAGIQYILPITASTQTLDEFKAHICISCSSSTSFTLGHTDKIQARTRVDTAAARCTNSSSMSSTSGLVHLTYEQLLLLSFVYRSSLPRQTLFYRRLLKKSFCSVWRNLRRNSSSGWTTSMRAYTFSRVVWNSLSNGKSHRTSR